MRIALITDGISPYQIGGMQQHSAYLGKYLVESGYTVDLFHCVDQSTNEPSDLEVNKHFFENDYNFNEIKCFKFPVSIYFPGHYLWCSYKYSKMIYDSLKNSLDKYDFIYTKGFSGWKLLKESKKTTNNNFKIGVNFHGYEMYQYAPNIKMKLQHYLFRPFVKWININSDFIFSYGGEISNLIEAIGVEKEKIIEIPSGIEKKWLNQNILSVSSKIKLLFIGRNERRKGIIEIFSAIEILASQNINLEFHFIGPIKEKYFNQNSNLKLVFHGVVNDVNTKKNIIDNCDFLLCPSYSEGMPNVILEAMSRGLAIIATNVGAVSQLVNHENGILLENCSVENIYKSVLEVLNYDDNKVLALKNSSINKVEMNYTWEKIFNLMNFNILNKIVN